jgi:hypothetical protein
MPIRATFRTFMNYGHSNCPAHSLALPQIVELAKKYDALTMVDDAHGEGVLGQGGRGVVNHFGLEGEVAITCPDTSILTPQMSMMSDCAAGMLAPDRLISRLAVSRRRSP